MPQIITPAGIELKPTTEHIEEPYSDKVKEILERKGGKYKKMRAKINLSFLYDVTFLPQLLF